MSNDKIWIITDLDHCMCMGRERERKDHFDTIQHFANFVQTLAKIENYELVFLTDRGVGQLATLAYVLSASRFHAGESGTVVYDAIRHTNIVNPEFEANINMVHAVRARLRKKYPGISLEPGVESSIRVERVNGEELRDVITELAEVAEYHSDWVSEDHGDCISLKSPDINKGKGLRFLEGLYEQDGNPINYERALWVGNSQADIPAADRVIERGGMAAGVGNSSPSYRGFIERSGWHVAEKGFTEGYTEILEKFYDEMMK